METNPRRWIAALRHPQDRLASLVEPLTPEQLRSPSYHSWTIAEVLSHLGSQAQLYNEWLTAALEGTEPAGREAMLPVFDAWNARSPEDQAADSIADNELLVQRFEALTDDELQRMHLNLFGMELDGVGLPRARLTEHAVHTWDIAVALNPKAQVAPDAVALVIDSLGFIASRIGKPQGKAFRLHIHTSGPERDFALEVGDSVELRDWGGGAADGELIIPSEAFVRLIYGRLDPDHSPQVQLSGPVSLDDLRRIFPGV